MKIIILILSLVFSNALFCQHNSFLDGVAALNNKDFEKAEQKLSTAIQNGAKIEKSRFYRGIVRYNLGDLSGAITDFNACSSTIEKDYYLYLAKVYAAEGNHKKSIEYLKNYLNKTGYYKLKEIIKDEAFKSIIQSKEWEEFIANRKPSEIENTIQDIQYYLKKGNTEQARALIDNISDDEKPEPIYMLSSQAYAKENSLELAIYELKKALDISPENAEYLQQLGKYYTELNKTQKAINTYVELISYYPETFEAYSKLASLYNKNEEPENAIEYIEFYLHYFPENEEAIKLASDICLKNEEYKKALQHVNKLFNTGQIEADWYMTRGNIYSKTGSFKYAAEDFSMYLDLSPNNPEANLKLGNAHYQLGNTSLACYYWKRAKKFGAYEAIEQIQKHCE